MRSTIVQVTNLGISIKDSALNTLIFVTRLDTAGRFLARTCPSCSRTVRQSGPA